MTRKPSIAAPIWAPLEAPEGYDFQMDISRPNGALRYRELPRGIWQPGPLPFEKSRNSLRTNERKSAG